MNEKEPDETKPSTNGPLDALRRKTHDYVFNKHHEHKNVIRFRPCVYVIEKYGYDVNKMTSIKEFKVGMTDMDLFERITRSEYINHCILRYVLYIGIDGQRVDRMAEVIEKVLLKKCSDKYEKGILHLTESFKVPDDQEFFTFIEDFFSDLCFHYKNIGYEYRKYNLKIDSELLHSSREDLKDYRLKNDLNNNRPKVQQEIPPKGPPKSPIKEVPAKRPRLVLDEPDLEPEPVVTLEESELDRMLQDEIEREVRKQVKKRRWSQIFDITRKNDHNKNNNNNKKQK
jgi:hypothetical protein